MITGGLEFLLIALVVISVGILGNIGGFGGGVILVPLLNLIFDIPLKSVIGTMLSAMIIPAIIGASRAAKRKEIDYRSGLLIEIPTVIGVLIGTEFTDLLSESTLQLILGSLASVISISMIRVALKERQNVVSKPSSIIRKLSQLPPTIDIERNGVFTKLSLSFTTIAGFLIGLIAGMFGIGGGWLKTPLMIIGFSMTPVMASGTALFMILITSITGGISHFLSDNWDMQLFLVLTISLSLGSIIGDRLKTRLKSDHISMVISFSLLVIAIITLLQGISAYI